MVEIRHAQPRDLDAITEIYNALLQITTYEWTETLHTIAERASWLEAQQSEGRPVLVAVHAGDVVGWASYGDFRDSTRWPGYRYTVEHSIHIAQSHWGRGIGRTLLEALMRQAREAGKRTMVAAIDASNDRSIRFHERLSFFAVANMPGIGDKWGRRLDLVLMQRKLDDPPT